MRGELTDFARPNTHNTIVGMKQLPCTGIERQLKVFEQTPFMTETGIFGLRSVHGFEIAYNHQPLCSAACSVQRVGGVMRGIAENPCILQGLVLLLCEFDHVNAVGITKHVETASFAGSGFHIKSWEPHRPLLTLSGGPFHGHGGGLAQCEVGLKQTSKTPTGR